LTKASTPRGVTQLQYSITVVDLDIQSPSNPQHIGF
jgi:hypothetical protein